MDNLAKLDKAAMWRLPELTEAIICLNMPLEWTGDGDPVYSESDCKKLSTGLTAANTRIVELEGENQLLRDKYSDALQGIDALMDENARLTKALVECQEAFENGRDVGELPY